MPFHQSFTSYCREDVCSCLRNVTSPRNVTSSPVEWAAGLGRGFPAVFPPPTLNTRIADEFRRATASYDLISTHTKYAPSQRQWLTPLDDDLEGGELAAFHPRILALARIDGGLYGLPRNLDVKLLHYRKDLFGDAAERRMFQQRTGRELAVPATWDDLRDAALPFARGPLLDG